MGAQCLLFITQAHRPRAEYVKKKLRAERKKISLTLYSFSLLYQTSSSSGSPLTGPSKWRSSLERERIFRRETISPLLLGPQLQKNQENSSKSVKITLNFQTEKVHFSSFSSKLKRRKKSDFGAEKVNFKSEKCAEKSDEGLKSHFFSLWKRCTFFGQSWIQPFGLTFINYWQAPLILWPVYGLKQFNHLIQVIKSLKCSRWRFDFKVRAAVLLC